MQQILLFTVAFILFTPPITAQRSSVHDTKEVQVTGRVLDIVDSVPLFGIGIQLEPILEVPFARTDSLGRFVFRGTTRSTSLKIRLYNGFYVDDSLFRELPSSGQLDIGVMFLKRGPYPVERMIIPWCEPVDRPPESVPAGMWVARDWRSRVRVKWMLCDGFLREPRVLTRPPNTR
jgi:hypothetical protein